MKRKNQEWEAKLEESQSKQDQLIQKHMQHIEQLRQENTKKLSDLEACMRDNQER